MKRIWQIMGILLIVPLLLCGCQPQTVGGTQSDIQTPGVSVPMTDRGDGDMLSMTDIYGYTVQKWTLPDFCRIQTTDSYQVMGDTVQFLAEDQGTGGLTVVVMDTDGAVRNTVPVPEYTDPTRPENPSMYLKHAVLAEDGALFWMTGTDAAGVRLLRRYDAENPGVPATETVSAALPEDAAASTGLPEPPAKLRVVAVGGNGSPTAEQTRVLLLEEQRLTVYSHDLKRLGVIALPTCSASGNPLNSDMVFETAVMVTDRICMLGYRMTDACFVDLEQLCITKTPFSPDGASDIRYLRRYHEPADGQYMDYYVTPDGVFRKDSDADSPVMLCRFLDGALASSPSVILGIFRDGSPLICDFDYFSNTMAVMRLVPEQNDTAQTRRVITLASLQFGRLLAENARVFEDSEWMAQTVAAFNAENEQYYIEVQPSYFKRAQQRTGDVSALDILAEDLLAGTAPDLILIDSFETALLPYLEKNAFVDLQSVYGDLLLPSVRNAFSVNGQLSVLPLSFCVDTFLTCHGDFAPGDALTMRAFYDLAAALPDGSALTASERAIDRITANAVMSFVDREGKSCSFDSAAFCDLIRFSEKFNEQFVRAEYGTVSRNGWTYEVSEAAITDCLRDGRQVFVDFPMDTVSSWCAAKLIFDGSFTVCGYPSGAGRGASLRSGELLAVNADSSVLGGVKQFLDFVLSEPMQTSAALLERGMPVVRDALIAAMDLFTYQYFREPVFLSPDDMGAGGRYASGISLDYAGSSPVSLRETTYRDTEWVTYREVVFTEEDKAAMLAFLENCRMQANTDTVISSIVEEELSFWNGGARTLEETAKIIQSRVWIYLNE